MARSVFCPNTNLKDWKDLVEARPMEAYYLWNKYMGEVPSKYYISKSDLEISEENKNKALEWFNTFYPGNEVNFFDFATEIGNVARHGYVNNGALHLWKSASPDLLYHEAYHLIFRSMLSNKVREELYKDASKQFGEPTAEEIAKMTKDIKSFYKVDISAEEASKLVLEEKMADGFKDFMKSAGETTGLLNSIAKWFKGLFEWIKALLGSPLTLQQAYEVMSKGNTFSNFGARNIFRNPEQFHSLYSPNKFVDGLSPEQVNQAVDGLSYMVINEIKNYKEKLDISKVLGKKDKNYGSIVNGIVKSLYTIENEDTLSAEKHLFLKFKMIVLERYYLNAVANKNSELAAKYIEDIKSFMKDNKIKFSSYNEHERKIKIHIVANWYGTKDDVTGNELTPSWRNMVKLRLEEKGFKVTKSRKDDLRVEEEEGAHAAEGSHQLAYGKAFYTQNSYTRLSEKILSILSTIPVLEAIKTPEGKLIYREKKNPIFSNIPLYYNPREVYKWLQDTVSGNEPFSKKLIKLNKAAETKLPLLSIASKLSKLSDDNKLLMQRALSSEILNFKLIIFGKESKIINANTNSTAAKLLKNWSSRAIEVVTDEKIAINDRSLYVQVIPEQEASSEGDEELVNVGLKVKKDKYEKIVELYKEVRKNQSRATDDNFKTSGEKPSKAARDLGKLIWELGMNISSSNSLSEEDTIRNIQKILSSPYVGTEIIRGKVRNVKYENPKDIYAYIINGAKLKNILNTISNIAENREGISMSIKNSPTNFFADEKTGVKFIAELAAKFTDLSTDSINSPVGTEIFPYNFPTTLTKTIDNLADRIRKNKDKNIEEALGNYAKDKFINNERGLSIMFNQLINDPEYLEKFKASTLIGIRDQDNDGFETEELMSVKHYITRIIAFINNNDKNYYEVFLSNEADRGKMHPVPMTRLNSDKLEGYTQIDALKDSILDELFRINQAETTFYNKQIIPKYNVENGNAYKPELFQINFLDENNQWIFQNYNISNGNIEIKMSQLVESYVKYKANGTSLTPDLKKFETKLKDIINGFLKAYDNKAKKIAVQILNSDNKSSINAAFVKKYESSVKNITSSEKVKRVGLKEEGDKDVRIFSEMVKDFLIHEDIGKNELIKLTRGNRAMFSNNDAFTKRQKLITTPQNPIVTKSNMINPETGVAKVGANSTYSDFTFMDPQMKITKNIEDQHRNWVEDTKNMLRYSRFNNGTSSFSEELISQLNEYLPGNFDELDGVAYISLAFYRELTKGGVVNSNWEDYHEVAYQNYLKDPEGRFVYPEGNYKFPNGFKAGDNIPITALKPYGDELVNLYGINSPKLSKTAYFVITKEYTKDKPVLNDVRQRMELNPFETDNPYLNQNLKPIEVAYSNSSQKGVLLNPVSFQKDMNGNYILGQLNNITTNMNSMDSLGFPQTLLPMDSKEDDSETILGVQVKKNAISNIKKDSMYYYNAGLESEYAATGEELLDLYHMALDEKIKRGIDKVDKQLGINELLRVQKELISEKISESKVAIHERFIEAKMRTLKKARAVIEDKIDKAKMSDDFLSSLDIVIDPITKIPRFVISLDTPTHKELFLRTILKMYENEAYDQYLKGYEAVQTGIVGGFETNKTLKFLTIEGHNSNKNNGTRLVHAEVEIRSDLAEKYGIKPGDDLSTANIPEELLRFIGYRIPNQDKATVIIFKIKRFLPPGYGKAIVIPPQVVKLMGSDFDVDKMFLLFPRIDPTTGRKIIPKYENYIIKKSLKDATDSEIENIILDTMEAVLSNPEHYSETLFPSRPEIADKIKEDLIASNPSLSITKEFSGGEYEKESGTALRQSIIMRGLHSNALSGRNVATYGNINLSVDYSVKIVGDVERTKYLSAAPDSEFFGYDRNTTTDKIHSRYIHKAVDATNSMDHFHIMNDNGFTYNVQLVWKATYPNTQLLHFFLNQPIIRDFVKTFEDEYDGDLRRINNVYKKVVDKYELKDMPISYKKVGRTLPMSIDSIMNSTLDNRIALLNFIKFYLAGRQLSEIHKALTLDATGGISRIEDIHATMDRFNKYNNPENGKIDDIPIAWYGSNPNENVLYQFYSPKVKSAYGFEKSYLELFEHVSKIAAIFTPINESSSFKIMKDAIKKYTGLSYFTSDQHRDISNALMMLVLTREDSPIADFLNKPNSDNLYNPNIKGSTTLQKSIDIARKKYPNLNANQFIVSIEEYKTTATNFKTFTFDSSRQFSGNEKSRIKDDLNMLITRPQFYLEGVNFSSKEDKDKALEEIKQLGLNLCMHTLISDAFKKNASNYIGLIPDSFFLHKFNRRKDKPPISINDYFLEQGRVISNSSKSYFSKEDLVRYLRIFGESLSGGRPLVIRKNFKDKKFTNTLKLAEPSDSSPMIIVAGFGTGKNRKTAIMVKDFSQSGSDHVTYLNIYKTSNNKKHLFGGDFLNKSDISFAESAAEATITEAASENPKMDVIQLCMLK